MPVASPHSASGNQSAAMRGGAPRLKPWATAQTVWPRKTSANECDAHEPQRIAAPAQFMAALMRKPRWSDRASFSMKKEQGRNTNG